MNVSSYGEGSGLYRVHCSPMFPMPSGKLMLLNETVTSIMSLYYGSYR